jgi:putative transposase
VPVATPYKPQYRSPPYSHQSIPRMFYSLPELKGLPGLPTSDRQLRNLAAEWISRPREGRGGGFEFSIDSLPHVTVQALKQRELHSQFPFALLPSYGHQSPDLRSERARADSKVWYLTALGHFQKTHNLCLTKARELFTKAVNFGLIQIPASVSQWVSSTSESSLKRWAALIKISINDLQGKYRGKVSMLDLVPQLASEMERLLKASAKQIQRHLRVKFPSLKIPGTRAIASWKRRYRVSHPREYCRTVEGRDKYNSKFRNAEGSLSEAITHPNQRWEVDGTPTDVMLADGHRYTIMAAIDVYSRRVVVTLSQTATARAATNGLLRQSIIKLGVPSQIKMDNGAEYISNHFTGCLNALEIDAILCNPASPWQKGHIERFFGTMTRDLFAHLPGFVGHNSVERKALGAIRLGLTAEELEVELANWVTRYENRVHRSIGCTPMERWADGLKANPISAIANERTLDILLAEVVGGTTRRVGKEGISVNGHWYLSTEANYDLYKGQDVLCKYDPSDDAGTILCFTQSGDYLFTALCPELTGQSRQQLVIEVKKAKKIVRAKHQATLAYEEVVNPEIHAKAIDFVESLPANLPVLTKAEATEWEINRLKSEPLQDTSYLELIQDVTEQSSVPTDLTDRYLWYRFKIHSEGMDTTPALPFLLRFESDQQNWPAMIDADLKFVVPIELREHRSDDEYLRMLFKRLPVLKPQHESTPWRAYEQVLAIGYDYLLTDSQLRFKVDFEAQPQNQQIMSRLISDQYRGHIYQLDLNLALADRLDLDPLNWRFDAGYYQRYYFSGDVSELDSLHNISGQTPVRNPVFVCVK